MTSSLPTTSSYTTNLKNANSGTFSLNWNASFQSGLNPKEQLQIDGFMMYCIYMISIQKQPLEVFCKKALLRNSTKFTGKHVWQSLFFNKVAGLRPATLLKKRLWHRCFPVNFVKFLRTPFLRNTSRLLLLSIIVTIDIMVINTFIIAEAALRRCSSKYVFLKFRKFHRKTLVLESVFK